MSNEIIFSEQIFDNVFERKVLFEKYDPYLGAVLLTDGTSWRYPNLNTESVIQAIENLKPLLYGEIHEEREILCDVVSLSNVSHVIKNIFLRDGKIYGEVTWLDTPSGRIMKELLRNNFQAKFMIRATGNINQAETEIANIITWDVKTI